MGNIFKQLALKIIKDKPTLQATRMTIEKCENIHLHYRNQRLEFSEKEFKFFVSEIEKAREQLDKAPKETEFFPLSASLNLSPTPTFFPKRISIEANIGSVHLHYKNLRLEFTPDELYEVSEAIESATKELGRVRYDVRKLPIEAILVNDSGHQINKNHPDGYICHDQDSHKVHIQKIKEAILEGKTIRPVAVLDEGKETFQRMDGFCRYVAFVELGYTSIECIVSKLAFAGCQHKLSFVVKEKEYEDILKGRCF